MKYVFSILITICLLLPAIAQAKQFNWRLKPGQDSVLISNGDVSVSASCLDNGGDPSFRLYGQTTASRALLASPIANYPGAGDYLTPATSIEDSIIAEVVPIEPETEFNTTVDVDLSIISLDTLRGLTTQKSFATVGLNLNGEPGCWLSINLEKIRNYKPVK